MKKKCKKAIKMNKFFIYILHVNETTINKIFIIINPKSNGTFTL